MAQSLRPHTACVKILKIIEGWSGTWPCCVGSGALDLTLKSPIKAMPLLAGLLTLKARCTCEDTPSHIFSFPLPTHTYTLLSRWRSQP
jgi:hypothetical protein